MKILYSMKNSKYLNFMVLFSTPINTLQHYTFQKTKNYKAHYRETILLNFKSLINLALSKVNFSDNYLSCAEHRKNHNKKNKERF